MRPTRDEIGARVDALAHEHDGSGFVSAVRRLADELGPDAAPLLQEILLERAADEKAFREAVAGRVAEHGWGRRTLARLERAWGTDRARELAAALEAEPRDEELVAAETERLRADRGKAALALDELSRHRSPRVRAWAASAGAQVLGDGAARLLLSLTRDRDAGVRETALEALLGVDREAAGAAAADLRRRLHARREEERLAAAWGLAELRDRRALGVLLARAQGAESAGERRVAAAAALVVEEDAAAVARLLRDADADAAPALARAARILAAPEATAALRQRASAGDEAAAACRAELERLGEEA